MKNYSTTNAGQMTRRMTQVLQTSEGTTKYLDPYSKDHDSIVTYLNTHTLQHYTQVLLQYHHLHFRIRIQIFRSSIT